MMEELANCPFCNGLAVNRVKSYGTVGRAMLSGSYEITCSGCGIPKIEYSVTIELTDDAGFIFRESRKFEAIKKWNTRSTWRELT